MKNSTVFALLFSLCTSVAMGQEASEAPTAPQKKVEVDVLLCDTLDEIVDVIVQQDRASPVEAVRAVATMIRQHGQRSSGEAVRAINEKAGRNACGSGRASFIKHDFTFGLKNSKEHINVEVWSVTVLSYINAYNGTESVLQSPVNAFVLYNVDSPTT
jgi:hypothetical protein